MPHATYRAFRDSGAVIHSPAFAADVPPVQVVEVARHDGLLPEGESELAGNVPRRVIGRVDDGQDLAAVDVRCVREHGWTRRGGVAPAAYLRDQPVSELEAATAVEVEPVDTRVADHDPCGTFDHRLLREG